MLIGPPNLPHNRARLLHNASRGDSERAGQQLPGSRPYWELA